MKIFFLFSSRRRHTRLVSDWSSDVCSSDRSEEHTSELQSLTNSYAVFCLRSEEHTSELQSLTNLVCRLLLEKKHLQPKRRIRNLIITIYLSAEMILAKQIMAELQVVPVNRFVSPELLAQERLLPVHIQGYLILEVKPMCGMLMFVMLMPQRLLVPWLVRDRVMAEVRFMSTMRRPLVW